MDDKKLKNKLIIAVIIFFLAAIILGVSIWASQSGKNRFNADLNVSGRGINARISAKVTGSKNGTGEGYDYDKLLWDSGEEESDIPNIVWDDIDFTFTNKESVIELAVIVENRNTLNSIEVEYTAKIGEFEVTGEEQEIGNTNIKAYIVNPGSIDAAVDEMTPTVAVFKLILKVANGNFSIKSTDINVNLVLIDPTVA